MIDAGDSESRGLFSVGKGILDISLSIIIPLETKFTEGEICSYICFKSEKSVRVT